MPPVTSAADRPYQASQDDVRLLARLRAGDEAAFMELVDRLGMQMLRVARMYVSSRAVAEDVVQETWLAVLGSLDRFQGRSSLKTWIFSILVNRAKSRGQREGRIVPFSSLGPEASGPDERAVDPDRFRGADDPWPGHWASPPRAFRSQPEERLLSAETRAVIDDAIEQLPPNQRAVITLRDVQGWEPEDVCSLLDITDANQRVLLHRARSRVRAALERYLDG